MRALLKGSRLWESGAPRQLQDFLSLRDGVHILAALRLWQETTNRYEDWIGEISTNQGAVVPLNDEEIEDLCERINTTEES